MNFGPFWGLLSVFPIKEHWETACLLLSLLLEPMGTDTLPFSLSHRGCWAIMGNTTSERVSGERHGSKSHRSDGSGAPHPTKEHPHKIMVGSTDDPSVFSSHDSKVGAGHCLCCSALWGPVGLQHAGCVRLCSHPCERSVESWEAGGALRCSCLGCADGLVESRGK